MGDPAFQRLQYEFTAHMRDPTSSPAPAGLEDRRLKIYRELLYNNVQGLLANSFPVLRKITPKDAWHALVRDYYRDHQARTPLFPRLPQEFLNYLVNERGVRDGDQPFMLELAHYEWLELSLSIDTRVIDDGDVDIEGDLLSGVPIASPLVHPVAYRFPVHRIGPSFQPEEPGAQPSYLVVYRDRNDKVGFMELNPVAARLLELIVNGDNVNGETLLMQIAAELSHPSPDIVVHGGAEILRELRESDVLLGARVN
jgi:hypothetical protein